MYKTKVQNLNNDTRNAFVFYSFNDKDTHDMNQKITELKNKLDKAKEYVEKMPGIQLSKSEQLKQIDILRNQLTVKTEILEKYKNNSPFDLSH
ncbi:hypothetical protein FSP39_016636 [Pinctada imbricata]|uniref:Mediator of RNA polymerase II transcription subunit 9 n=1 Tax=Pinctada imbricata TaxID=66713 RepID=A0AA89BXC5_PINIB|nr:hypothetical protein FSP39_016636 [Pinctada imbricata]